MTITESELREILTGEGREDQHRGVTVADVDRRVRVIKRRRLRVVGAVAGLGIVAGLAFAVPQVRNTVVPEDIWTGVMAQPTKTPRVVSTAAGGPVLLGMLANRRYQGRRSPQGVHRCDRVLAVLRESVVLRNADEGRALD